MSELNRAPVVTIEGLDRDFTCDKGDLILRAALRAGLGFPYECATGSCGTCKYELLVGHVEDTWPEAPGIRLRDREHGRYLACQSKATGPIVIRVRLDERLRPPIPPRRSVATISGRIYQAPGYSELKLQISDEGAEFLPGQFILIEFPGLTGARAYSMSNQPNTDGVLQLHVKAKQEGIMSNLLVSESPIGTKLIVDGPYGHAFARLEDSRPVVCIAGGSGLGPMLSVAGALALTPLASQRSVDFFYGVRTPAEVCDLSDLRKQAEAFGRWGLHVAVSDKPDNSWNGLVGMIDQIVQVHLPMPWSNSLFYIAGPPPMVDAVVRVLLTCQVSHEQLIFDRFY